MSTQKLLENKEWRLAPADLKGLAPETTDMEARADDDGYTSPSNQPSEKSLRCRAIIAMNIFAVSQTAQSIIFKLCA